MPVYGHQDRGRREMSGPQWPGQGKEGRGMEKIVVVGAGEFQCPLIVKAKEMGFETHVFAWEDGSIGRQEADFFYPISVTEKEKILGICREIRPCAAVTVASDLANITVQYLAERLGLACNPVQCVRNTTDKYAMRTALMRAGVAVPRFARAGEGGGWHSVARGMEFPLIVKPTDRSGSRGITKIGSLDRLGGAVEDAMRHSFEKKAIIEEYIDGEEYSCECISYKGVHTFLALTKKYTTGAPHFIETGHMEPAPLGGLAVEEIKREIFRALDALGIECGASHSEFKVTPKGEVRIIEVGSRMGGDFIGSHLVELSTGYDFLRMVVEVAAGGPPTLARHHAPQYAGVKFIFSREDLRQYGALKENAPGLIRFASEPKEVGTHEVADSSGRYGCYVVASGSEDEVRDIVSGKAAGAISDRKG